MCEQQQLDSNLYLAKLKRDYALAMGFPKSTSVESLEEGPNSTLILSINRLQRSKKNVMLIDVYRLASPNRCPLLCYKLMDLQWLNALTQLIELLLVTPVSSTAKVGSLSSVKML